MGRVHSSIETYSYKCAAGLKTLLVQYLMMQNRHMTGEDENPTSKEEWKKMNRGMPLLTDLCLAMRSDPMGIIRGLEEVVTCIYGPAVTYAFPDPLVTTYRHSVTHLSLISILDGTALNWCQQEVGPYGDNPGSRGGGDLHLWSSSDVRIPRSPGDNVSLTV